MADIRGVLFDKDGTLFNFHATWAVWSLALLADLSGGDAGQVDRLGAAIGFDPVSSEFAPDSPVIACTTSEIAELLLKHGANVEGGSPDGKTPLMMAAMFNRQAILELLLANGARIDAVDSRGMTAVSLAKMMTAADTLAHLNSLGQTA